MSAATEAISISGVSARRTAVLILAVLFSLTLVLSAMVPLLPRFVDQFGISTVQAGALFSVVTVVMLTTSIPVGLLADRVGPRRLALAATSILVFSCLLQGLASSYWMLLGGRAVFGIAHTTIWAAALTWLAQLDLSGRGRAMAVGGTMTVAGAGHSIGPLFVGGTAEHIGLLFPFAVAASLAVLVVFALARSPDPPRARAEERPPFRRTFWAARREPYVAASLLLLVTSGGMMIGFSLLIPLRLDRNGFSEAAIGAVFSAFGVVTVLVSATVNRLGERLARPVVGGLCLAWQAAACLLPAMSQSTAAILAFMAISGWAGSTLITISYPIGAEGAHRAGLPRGAVMGLLNTAWAASATLAPLGGGAVAQSFGDRAAWIAVSSVLAAGSLVVLGVVRRTRNALA